MKASIALSGNFANTGEAFQLHQGISLAYDLTANQVNSGDTGFTARITSAAKVTKQIKVPAESQVVSLAVLGQAANLVVNAGLQNARNVTQSNSDKEVAIKAVLNPTIWDCIMNNTSFYALYIKKDTVLIIM